MIPIPSSLLIKAASVVLVVAGAFSAGWWVNGDRWSDKYAAREAQIGVQIAAANLAARTKEQDVAALQLRLEKEHATQLALADGRLRAALERVRNAERAALQPAPAAPAECREFACSPTRLSVQDAGFLVGLADRSDRVVLQLQSCQRELQGTVDAVNADDRP